MTIDVLEAGGAEPPLPQATGGPAGRVIRWIIRAWAVYFGGALLLFLVALTTLSAILNLLWHRPIAGDYEIVKHLMAIIIFSFLPYCELVGANITVDVFTERAGPKAKAWMSLLSAAFALIFSLILLRQSYFGFLDYRKFVEVTGVLSIPLWTAFPFILFSVALWVIAAAISVVDAVRGTRRKAASPELTS